MRKGIIPVFSKEIEEALQQVMTVSNNNNTNTTTDNTQTNNNATATASAAGGGDRTPQQNNNSADDLSSLDKTNQQQQQQQGGVETTTGTGGGSQNLLNDLSVFDLPSFSAVDFINRRFPDENSLDGLGSYIEEVRRRLSDTESSLLDAVRVQACTAATAGKDLDQAKRAVLTLRSRVEEIKKKADHSEATVVSICSSIRQLDTAKRNLTDSIVTINQLQLFLRAVQGLDRAIHARNYGTVNDLLRQALRYSERFEPYYDVPKVKELHIKLMALKRRIHSTVVTDILHELCPQLRRYVSASNTNVQLGREGLIQACLVVDALGHDVMQEVRKEYIESQLEEYTAYLFKRGSKEAALERWERRFIWFRQTLEKSEEVFLAIFPLHWYTMQEMCVEFAMRTAEELRHQLRYESGSVEVAVLIYMLQKTMDAEKDLTSRMKWYEMELREKLKSHQEEFDRHASSSHHHHGSSSGTSTSASAVTTSSSTSSISPPPLSPNAVQEYKVFGFMTSCFDDYLDKYVQHEDQSMHQTIEGQLESDSINEELLVLQSTQDIFLFIQESMRRAATITSSRSQSTLTDLCAVWHKHLNDYAKTLSKLAAQIPSSKEDERMMCIIVNSADYCRSAAEGLGEDLLRLLDDKESFNQTHNDVVANFSQVCTFASTQLAEAVCANLNNLVNDYQTYLASGATSSGSAHISSEAIDESFFPGSVRRVLNDHFTSFATYLLPNLFSFVITKAATTFIPRMNKLLYRPKGGRLSDSVISQMRVDMSPLERAFTAAPIVATNAAKEATQNPFSTTIRGGSKANQQQQKSSSGGDGGNDTQFSSPAFSKTVRREFGRIMAALRVLQLPPGERFIEGYYQTVDKEDRSETDCARLLELLGVSKEDQRQWLALLKRRGDVPIQTRRDNIIAMLGGGGVTSSSSSGGGGTSTGGMQNVTSSSGGMTTSSSNQQQGTTSSMGSRFVSLFAGDDAKNPNAKSGDGAGQQGNTASSARETQDAWSKLKTSLFNRK